MKPIKLLTKLAELEMNNSHKLSNIQHKLCNKMGLTTIFNSNIMRLVIII
jgi:hypothetical protein